MPLTDNELLVSVLLTDVERTGYAEALPKIKGQPASLSVLAGALASSPLWSGMPRATLVIRPAPDPLLAVVGYFDAAGKARLHALRWQLEYVLPHLRYVTYAQAEADCERLAQRLLERFSHDELREFRFVAIPRGGYIVLGMLAYTLGLRPSQLEPPHPPEVPLVVVDDCAISGFRFGRFIERRENRRVVFAHLYSPPDLRHAIEARESRDVACVSAQDLYDHAPKLLDEEYSAWRERWLSRMDHRSYWVGQPDHVCFAWNEPDIGFWNPVTEHEESGWRFIPPELCLKNRLADGAKPVLVQVQPEPQGQLRAPSHVLFGELEEQVVVGNLRTEESFVLSGVAADMWRAVVECGNLDKVTNVLLRSYDVDRATLKADLQSFVEDLLSQGLLENDT